MTPGALVVCSLEPWDEVWRRNQFLVAGLLAADPALRVLFVEPPADPVHELVSRRRPRPARGLVAEPGFDGRLLRLQLSKWLPRKIWRGTDEWLARRVLRVARRQRLIDPVLWINDPNWVPLLLDSGWPALYDITDDWVQADRTPAEHQRLVDHEAVLLRSCGAVVVCSPQLAATKGAERPVVLIPNGVDVTRYRDPAPRPADLPERSALYLGTLHEDRLDVELVAASGAALAARGGTLVLVGPNALNLEHAAALADAPGVRFLGPRPNRDVPAYLQHADVLVVPHAVNAFTDSLDPIKVYEYLAVGRPVLSTPVAGFRELADRPGVTVAAGQRFTEAAAELVHPTRPGTTHAEVGDWSERVTAMAAVLAGLSR